MKKIIGATLLAIIAVGFGATVQAEDATVTYDVASTYSLSIPAKTLTDTDREWVIGTNKHDIAPGKKLDIGLSLTNTAMDDEGKVTLSQDTGTNKLTTKMTINGSTILKGSSILQVAGTSDSGKEEKISFEQLAGNKQAGTYKAQLNFTAEIK